MSLTTFQLDALVAPVWNELTPGEKISLLHDVILEHLIEEERRSRYGSELLGEAQLDTGDLEDEQISS